VCACHLVACLTIDGGDARGTMSRARIMSTRQSKPEIEVPRKASFAVGGTDRSTAWIVRLSLVGAELESLLPPEAGSGIVLWTKLADADGELELRGRVQWARGPRFGVQFGPLGVRETHAIVRLGRGRAA
jgi:hypothetical protein